MTNNALIRQFEQGLIPCDAFHHADHVRVAFAYLCEYSVAEALERFVVALKRFATACGKPQLYNENITRSYFALISERMAAREGSSWEEFSRCNPDLLVWKRGNPEALLSRSSQ